MQLNDSEEVDQQVLTAGQAAMDSGRITPLLKVELWAKIQSRRLSEGKEEMKVQFNNPKNEPLTSDEVLRQKVRRESNRIAAQKCRRKKKESKCKVEELLHELQQRNLELKTTISFLEEEKDSFIQRLACPISSAQVESDCITSPVSHIEEEVVEEEPLEDLWYFNSSQEVPTSSYPPPESVEPLPPTPEKKCTSAEVGEEMMDDWYTEAIDFNTFLN